MKRKEKYGLIRITLLSIISLFFYSLSSAQTDRYVNASGTCTGGTPCYTNVQDAINASSTSVQDIIHVEAGSYPGFTVNKSVQIEGANKDIRGYDSRGAESEITDDIVVSNTNNVSINGLRVYLDGTGNRLLDVTNVNNISISHCYLFALNMALFLPKEGLRFSNASTIEISNNQIAFANTGIELQDCSGVDITGNIIGDVPGSFTFDGGMFDAALLVGESCEEVTFSNNYTSNVFGTSAPGNIRIFAGPQNASSQGLTGQLTIARNYIENLNTFGIYFVDGDNTLTYNGSLISIRENFFPSSGPAFYTGNQSPSTNIDVNANFWSTGGPPGKGDGFSINGAAVNNVDAVVWLYNATDVDINEVGYQSNQQLAFDPDFPYTIQEAIDAVPIDLVERWELQVGFARQNYNEAIVVNKPMILNGSYNSSPTFSTLTSNNASFDEIIKVDEDNVTLKNFNVNITDPNVNRGVYYEGRSEGIIEQINFTNAALTDFQYLTIDSRQASAPFQQVEVRVENCTFREGTVLGGTALTFLNGNRGVSGQPTPIFSSLTAENNTFENNLQYFVRLDGTPGQEFDASIDLSTNTFAVPTSRAIAAMNEAERFTLEDKIVHAIDVPNVGFLTYSAGSYYVTPNSFFTPFTSEADVNRAINLASAGETVHLQGGSYPGNTQVNKPLTFDVENAQVATLNTLTSNFSGTLTVEGDLAVGNTLSLSNGFIEHTSGTFILAPTFTTLTGGNTNSFIKTAVRYDHRGNTTPFNITFPIGSGSNDYRPVTINGMNGTNLTVTLNTDAPRTGGTGVDDSFACIDAFPRVWSLQTTGTIDENGNITLNYAAGDGVNDPTIPNRLLVGLATSESGTYSPTTLVNAATTQPTGSLTARVESPLSIGANNFLVIGAARPPAPPLTIVGTTIVCESTTTTLSIENPDPTFSYAWFDDTDTQIATGASVDIDAVSVGGTGSSATFTARYEDPVINCLSGEADVTVNVINQPNATFSYAASSYCKDGTTPNPVANVNASAVGIGRFTAAPAGLVFVDDVAGEIDLNATADGTYTITFSVGGGVSGCTLFTQTTNITISSAATANITAEVEPFENIIYFCGDQGVVLNTPDQSDYTYQWQEGGTDIAGAEAATFTASSSGSYQVVVTNGCGTVTSSPVVVEQIQAPIVSIQQAGITINTINAALGEEVPIEVALENPIGNETYTWEPTTGIDDPTSSTPTITALETVTYTLTVTSGAGCITTQTLTLETADEVFVPNAFFPNSTNNNNQSFKVFGFGIAEISLTVYDRFGNLVYETNDVSQAQNIGWDGTNNGERLPQGAYVWYLKGKKVNGEELNFNGKTYGTVMLVQ